MLYVPFTTFYSLISFLRRVISTPDNNNISLVPNGKNLKKYIYGYFTVDTNNVYIKKKKIKSFRFYKINKIIYSRMMFTSPPSAVCDVNLLIVLMIIMTFQIR